MMTFLHDEEASIKTARFWKAWVCYGNQNLRAAFGKQRQF